MPAETAPSLILAFDTSGPYCAATLWRDGRAIATIVEPMKRGQAERLMPLLEEMLAQTGTGWRDLDAIGVGIGPGNFTGIRISVSAARGLAMGLNIPAVGVSTFQAISIDHTESHLAAVPAPRDQLYILSPSMDAPELVQAPVRTDLPVHLPPPAEGLVQNIARVATQQAASNPPRPAPLYIKPADAAPPRDPAPVILE